MGSVLEAERTARANVLRAEEPDGTDGSVLASSDRAIRERTGRGWEEWFELLDERGAAERTHREIAHWVASRQGVEPPAWNAQAVAGSYELARGLRVVGEKSQRVRDHVSKSVGVPVERLYDALLDEPLPERWLPGGELRERTATNPKSARFDWGESNTRVNVTFLPKGEAKRSRTYGRRASP